MGGKRMTLHPPLKRMHVGFQEYLYDEDLAVFPKFAFTIRHRINQKRATNVIVGGEGGIGKTYIAIQICRGLSKRFTIDQVVFNLEQFLEAVINTPMGVPIVFDEPSYAMSKREWYKELNQALVKTMESFRFKVHPLFIPVINKSLLDKTVRNYLLQYQVVVRDRGKAIVYRLSPSPFQDKTYQSFFCTLRYPLFDRHLCNKDSCLDCKSLTRETKPCELFRAQYERKKENIQGDRYEESLQDAQAKASSRFTNKKIADIATPHLEKFVNAKNKINVHDLRAVLEEDCNIRIGQNRTYDIRAILIRRFPQYAK
jgi:hypothetical protein